MASLSDEDAVYLHKVVSEVTISARGYDPLLFVRSFNFIHTKTETVAILLRALHELVNTNQHL